MTCSPSSASRSEEYLTAMRRTVIAYGDKSQERLSRNALTIAYRYNIGDSQDVSTKCHRYAEIVGLFLRDERERAGLSQKALEKKSGVAQSTISSIEAGKEGRPVKSDHIDKILSALNLDALYMCSELGRIASELLRQQAGMPPLPGQPIGEGRSRWLSEAGGRVESAPQAAPPSQQKSPHRKRPPRE